MSTGAHQPLWPTDPGHRDAIDTVLLMAAAEHRWGETRRALSLLDSAESIVGTLPRRYESLRSRCRLAHPARER